MECPACGARNSDGSSFCIRCGTRFAPVREADVLAPPPVADATAIVDEAAELFAAGRLDDAAAACRRALDEDPDLVAARALLGMVEEERGNLAEALAEYEAVIRLAPERTAERERADRLRPLVLAQMAPAVPDDWEPDLRRRRWIAAAIGGGVLVLVLLVGALVSMANRGPAPANAAGGAPLALTPNDASAPGMSQPTANAANGATIQADNALAGPGIGQFPQDQTALQPTQGGGEGGRSNGAGQGTPPPVSSMDHVPLPPPTVARSGGTGPLTPPTTSESEPTASTGPANVGQPAAPAAEQPRGRVRIWMGEPGTNTGAPPQGSGSVTGMSLGNQVSSGNALPATAPGFAGVQPIPGAPRQSYFGETSPSFVPPRSGTNSTSSIAPRSGYGGESSQGTRPQLLSPPPSSGAGGPVPLRSTGGGYPSGGAASAPVRTAAASSPARNTGAGGGSQSSASPRSSSSAAAELRARAQAAMAAGRAAEARSLYAAAIASYEAEARRNPERAAASRSAAESCRRALEALGGGH
jgi:hypothetical protein